MLSARPPCLANPCPAGRAAAHGALCQRRLRPAHLRCRRLPAAVRAAALLLAPQPLLSRARGVPAASTFWRTARPALPAGSADQRCPTLVLPCRLPTPLPPVQCCRGRTCRGRCRWGRWSNTWRRLRPTCEARQARRRQQQARRVQLQTRRRRQQQQQQQLLQQQCRRAARLLRAAQPGMFTLSCAPTLWWVARAAGTATRLLALLHVCMLAA